MAATVIRRANCKVCSAQFAAKAANAMFCSKKCRLSHRRLNRSDKNFEKKCITCDTAFVAQNYKARYCSPSCEQHEIKCRSCGDTFRGFKNRAFCSDECFAEHRRLRARKRQPKVRENRTGHERMKRRLSARINHAVKAQATKKCFVTDVLVGCAVPELLDHLSSKFAEGMTLDNYGDWHIDHMRPCASFDLTDPEQQKECFHYTNLQPLWAKDNLSKGARYNG